jgi:hypothetical protein
MLYLIVAEDGILRKAEALDHPAISTKKQKPLGEQEK